MTLRRYAPIAPSRGTTWPPEVREHVSAHQGSHGCIGPLAGMPGDCSGATELDHVRASHAVGMKSESIATNAGRLCGLHHRLKTNNGRTWRPVLLELINTLAGDCARCSEERARVYGVTA